MPSRKSHIQLYADECFPVPSATHLKSLGYSVIHASDATMLGKSDKEHLQYAKQIGRVLITLDRDFLHFSATSLQNHPGVIVVSARSAIPTSVDKVVEKVLKKISEDMVRGSLLKVTKDKLVKRKDGKKVFEKEIS